MQRCKKKNFVSVKDEITSMHKKVNKSQYANRTYLQNGNKNIFGFPTNKWQLKLLNLVKISSTSTFPPSTNSTSLCSPWLNTANTKQSYVRMSLLWTILFKKSKNSYKIDMHKLL